ncbi:uncharacterized protein LOC119334638 isoform X4 [Triticum dicoccoides]|uniref:uncharacterized protein LOC119334638 isoform X4 n=1 Tax=Triticum dicoccoides TaxID=85692 RepID=UPI001891E9C8|nr:uncharacterized protein LOC119334638 isoform X4 [Triticum dicoccoides]
MPTDPRLLHLRFSHPSFSRATDPFMAADPQRPRPLHLGQCGSRPATRWRRSGYRRSLTLCHALPPCLLLRLRWPDASSTPADLSAYLCPCATPMEPRCLKKGLETNCPICCDFLFTSSKEVRAVLSGHSMHSTCLQGHPHHWRILYFSGQTVCSHTWSPSSFSLLLSTWISSWMRATRRARSPSGPATASRISRPRN